MPDEPQLEFRDPPPSRQLTRWADLLAPLLEHPERCLAHAEAGP